MKLKTRHCIYQRWYFVSFFSFSCTHTNFKQECCNLQSLWIFNFFCKDLCVCLNFFSWHFERWLLNNTCLCVEHSPNSLYQMSFCVHPWFQALQYTTYIYSCVYIFVYTQLKELEVCVYRKCDNLFRSQLCPNKYLYQQYLVYVFEPIFSTKKSKYYTNDDWNTVYHGLWLEHRK